jgi:hypothetical protein
MTKIEKIKQGLLAELYQEFKESLELIANLDKMPDDLLDFILNVENTINVMDCLFECPYFTQKQLKKIAKFIRQNLYHSDPLFRRELLEFAISAGIEGFYEDCLQMIKNHEENEMVVFIACMYVYEQMPITDLPRVKEAYEKVLNHENYYQNCQTVACFYLFRLTHQPDYLDFLKESMPLNSGINKSVLRNLLKEEYHQAPYFAHYEEMMRWAEDGFEG